MPITPKEFLRDYWQKKPVVLKQYFPAFTDFIDEHELAYLAQDSELDSRAIINEGAKWEVIQGPFNDFTDVCHDKWTLLVQGVDKVHPDASELMDAFNFIPYWRMDDLMISYAVTGAGVGPHIDQYDVFLVQGKGSRRWRVGKPGKHQSIHPHPLLSQVKPFEAEIDVELTTGDVLYIPPNWPHDGVATSDCLTYSVGFRAPDTASITRSFDLLFTESSYRSERYSDPTLSYHDHPGYISATTIKQLKNQLINALEDPLWEQALLRILSEQDLLVHPPESLITPDELREALSTGETYHRLPGCRPTFTQSQDKLRVFIDGEYFEISENADVIKTCLSGTPVNSDLVNKCPDQPAFISLFSMLVNKGFWIAESETEE